MWFLAHVLPLHSVHPQIRVPSTPVSTFSCSQLSQLDCLSFKTENLPLTGHILLLLVVRIRRALLNFVGRALDQSAVVFYRIVQFVTKHFPPSLFHKRLKPFRYVVGVLC